MARTGAARVMRAIGEGLRGVPGPMIPGLIVFAMASALDLAFHLAPFGWGETMEGYLGGEGYLAHLGIMAGMSLTLAGLIAWRIARTGNARRRTVRRLGSPEG